MDTHPPVSRLASAFVLLVSSPRIAAAADGSNPFTTVIDFIQEMMVGVSGLADFAGGEQVAAFKLLLFLLFFVVLYASGRGVFKGFEKRNTYATAVAFLISFGAVIVLPDVIIRYVMETFGAVLAALLLIVLNAIPIAFMYAGSVGSDEVLGKSDGGAVPWSAPDLFDSRRALAATRMLVSFFMLFFLSYLEGSFGMSASQATVGSTATEASGGLGGPFADVILTIFGTANGLLVFFYAVVFFVELVYLIKGEGSSNGNGGTEAGSSRRPASSQSGSSSGGGGSSADHGSSSDDGSPTPRRRSSRSSSDGSGGSDSSSSDTSTPSSSRQGDVADGLDDVSDEEEHLHDEAGELETILGKLQSIVQELRSAVSRGDASTVKELVNVAEDLVDGSDSSLQAALEESEETVQRALEKAREVYDEAKEQTVRAASDARIIEHSNTKSPWRRDKDTGVDGFHLSDLENLAEIQKYADERDTFGTKDVFEDLIYRYENAEDIVSNDPRRQADDVKLESFKEAYQLASLLPQFHPPSFTHPDAAPKKLSERRGHLLDEMKQFRDHYQQAREKLYEELSEYQQETASGEDIPEQVRAILPDEELEEPVFLSQLNLRGDADDHLREKEEVYQDLHKTMELLEEHMHILEQLDQTYHAKDITLAGAEYSLEDLIDVFRSELSKIRDKADNVSAEDLGSSVNLEDLQQTFQQLLSMVSRVKSLLETYNRVDDPSTFVSDLRDEAKGIRAQEAQRRQQQRGRQRRPPQPR